MRFRRQPTKADFDRANELILRMTRRVHERREMAEFKPGELTPEEEELVKREGLNRFNYIPISTLDRHAERMRGPIPPRPASDLGQAFSERIDGSGYILWL